MKTTSKVLFVLLILTLSLSFISCDEKKGAEPVETPINKLNDDGSTTEGKKVVYENGDSVLDTETNYPDGKKIVLHEEETMDDHGNVQKESKTTTTFPASAVPTEKKTETVETKSGMDEIKGQCEENKTTTVYNDGSKEITFSRTEAKTGLEESSKETIKADGSSEKESSIFTESDSSTPYTQKETKESKDTNGKLTQKVETVIETQSYNPAIEGSIKSTVTTTAYTAGEVSSITVETYRSYKLGDNDGSYTKEVKNGAGVTQSKVVELFFHDKGKIVFSFDGTNRKAKADGTFANENYTHTAFVTTLSTYDTVVAVDVEEDTITIVSIDGTDVNESYTIDSGLSITGKF